MSLKDIIETKTKELEKIMVSDFQSASKFYTEDCVLMVSNGQTIIGRDGTLQPFRNF